MFLHTPEAYVVLCLLFTCHLVLRYNCCRPALHYSSKSTLLSDCNALFVVMAATLPMCCRAPAIARQLLSQALLVDNDENARPNSIQQLPESQDAKSERIRQLHLTLGALIDERDELQDTLSSSASPELARQLEDAQAELRVLRKYAGSQTSGRTSLAELDMLSFRQN